MDDDELVGRQGQLDLAPGQVAAIEEERRSSDAVGDGELVHQARPHTHVAVLRALAGASEGQGIDLGSGRPGEGPRGGQLQRRRRREAGALRQIGGQHAGEGRQRLAGPFELEGGAGQVVDPVVPGAADPAQREASLSAVRRERDADVPAARRDEREADLQVDGHGHDQPGVVVGVLADEVHPTRGAHHRRGREVTAASGGLGEAGEEGGPIHRRKRTVRVDRPWAARA